MVVNSEAFNENQRTSPVSDLRRFVSIGDLRLDSGAILPDVTLAYQEWGTLNSNRDNAVLVFHALTGDSHAAGWWSGIVGPGAPIDTDRYYVVCSNVLGGCQGSTGPTSLRPDGKPYQANFPSISIRDMVRAQAGLTDALGVEKWALLAGGSMGGMQALGWVEMYPERFRSAYITASAARHNAMQIGFNEVGRQAIYADPDWQGGFYSPERPPVKGLAVARMLGHMTFLSSEAFDHKFGRTIQEGSGTQFSVESYLNYQGKKFTDRFDANSLVLLTKALDNFDFGPQKEIKNRFFLSSFTKDWLYTPVMLGQLHRELESFGAKVEHQVLESAIGHDAFLLEAGLQKSILLKALDF